MFSRDSFILPAIVQEIRLDGPNFRRKLSEVYPNSIFPFKKSMMEKKCNLCENFLMVMLHVIPTFSSIDFYSAYLAAI